MVKTTFKTLGLFIVFSFIFMYFSGFLNFFLNFLVMLSYNVRLAISPILTTGFYFPIMYTLSKTEGYNLTGKLKFDKKAQTEGVVIGAVIYGILTFILAFAEKNFQNMFLQFFYNGHMINGALYQLNIFQTTDLTTSYFFTLAILPFITLTRLWGLFRGRAMRIKKTPAFESQNIEKVLVEEEIKPRSWRDSIKLE